MEKHELIFGIAAAGAAVWLLLAKLKDRRPQPDSDKKKPFEKSLQAEEVSNDKLVLVEGASDTDIRKILQEFCNLYNKEACQAILRLTKLSDGKFAITFPYDISFEIFCYFINYVNYPIGFDRSFMTTAWATTRPADICTTEKSVNKNVMLFLSDFDKEYDNVFMTTSDNYGYKLGFAMGEEKQPLKVPEKSYVAPPVSVKDLDTGESIDFR